MDIKQYLQRHVEGLSRGHRMSSTNLHRQGYAYSGVAEWFLKHGNDMRRGAGRWTQRELDIICDLAQRVQLRQGHCFANAQRMVLASIGLSEIRPDKELAYCEGYAWIAGQPAPFAHGWCLLNDRVWDPSLDGHPAREIAYFGMGFPTADLVTRVFHRGEFGPLVNDWKKQWPLLRQPWRGRATLPVAAGSSSA